MSTFLISVLFGMVGAGISIAIDPKRGFISWLIGVVTLGSLLSTLGQIRHEQGLPACVPISNIHLSKGV